MGTESLIEEENTATLHKPVSFGELLHHEVIVDVDQQERPELYEGTKAATCAGALIVTASSIFVGCALSDYKKPIDLIGPLSFYVSLFCIPHFWVHREKTLFNNLGFVLATGTLALQPHQDVCKRVPVVGAINGAASVMVMCRSLQYYFNQEDFKDWKPWRRTFFISAWGWHDHRKLAWLGPKLAREKLVAELKKLLKWALILISTVLVHKFVLGSPAELKQRGLLRIAYFMSRWTVGFWTLLAWFNCMDAFPRALHFFADEHELRHISEDPWEARDLKEFWRRWNVPVQEMLLGGIYYPISKRKWLGPNRKLLAKALVFLASAGGHTYAISCGGLPKKHLLAMFSFFLIQPVLLSVEDLGGFKGLPWMFAAEIPIAAAFIEPCLTFCHL